MAYIEFQDVYKIYNPGRQEVHALDGMSFEIEKGELCVIVGHSGSGKTTLLNILGGMDTATKGRVLFDGRDITGFSDQELTKFRREEVGFVFQFYNLVQNLTALENVELASEICRDGHDAGEMLARVGLGDRGDHFPAQLSGGEQQRVSIARALAKNPQIILCDEPTGALDYVTGKSVLKLLQTTCRETGKTVIIITHNGAIKKMADRVISIRSGKVEGCECNPEPVSVDEIEW
ncbi:MAG: ABC transporter ATP-binding protein [Clostridia bacterium]|nr:ABC transporter ATP-binding protein [Clostridia bacterium]